MQESSINVFHYQGYQLVQDHGKYPEERKLLLSQNYPLSQFVICISQYRKLPVRQL